MTADSRSPYRKTSRNRIRLGFAIGIASLLLVFALVLAPAWAGGAGQNGQTGQTGKAGSFATALKNRFCGGTSGANWYGCYAYMHYRVDLVKSKGEAKNICYNNGCGTKFGIGTPSYGNCKTGCDQAYAADTK